MDPSFSSIRPMQGLPPPRADAPRGGGPEVAPAESARGTESEAPRRARAGDSVRGVEAPRESPEPRGSRLLDPRGVVRLGGDEQGPAGGTSAMRAFAEVQAMGPSELVRQGGQLDLRV